jgi:hypothetical protein
VDDPHLLTFAAVTLRLWLPILISSGVDYIEAYQAVAWLSWVPNLLVAEWIVHRLRRSQPAGLSVSQRS